MEKIELFRNLVLMALADGTVREQELSLLSDRAKLWELDSVVIDQVFANAQAKKFSLEIPDSHSERIEMMRELVRMMAVDGELADLEMKLCAVAAAVMELKPMQMARVLDSLKENSRD
jgi:DnaJ-domain-containing protein 1